ncbi:SRR racemase, partial [Pedionomus torquatus]|nr:SRR racemase [Pedionomus torquatus]
SFQIRGALNAVRSLVEESQRAGKELPRAVVTHSSGNHGQALACAAQAEGAGGDRGAGYHCLGGAGAGEGNTQGCSKKRGYSRSQKHSHFLSAQAPEVNAVVVPVGGGGMIAGIAVAIKALRPDVKVFAAEPRNADDCYQSKVRGELTPNLHLPETIADAVKTSIGPNTWPIIRDLVDDVVTVSEEEIKRATRLVWERMKLLIEPTAGVGVAAVLSERFQAVPRDVENVCIVLCGGNVDLSSLTWLTDLPGKAE